MSYRAFIREGWRADYQDSLADLRWTLGLAICMSKLSFCSLGAQTSNTPSLEAKFDSKRPAACRVDGLSTSSPYIAALCNYDL